MLSRLTAALPPEGVKILLVLFLCFLVGLEREEHTSGAKAQGYSFGGVRTFPLIGLIGYALAFLSGNQLLPVMIGFAVIGGFLWLSYKNKLERLGVAGATTEVSALMTYVVGVLVSHGEFWIATSLAILGVLLLELKLMLEGLARRLPETEILAFTKFLLLTAVILPVLPNHDYGAVSFNPYKTWLVVVAASGISYASYLLQKFVHGRGGILTSAVLGGAYSSTLTTVVLAKRARAEDAPHLYAGNILVASGVMYLRLLLLIGLFSHGLLVHLLPRFLVLGIAGMLAGWLWSRRASAQSRTKNPEIKNPLEMSAAFLFALLFVILLVATHYAIAFFGRGGVYGLAALTGVTDIDPFVLGLTQSSPAATPLALASAGIIVAAASNNLVKGFYALAFADRKTGVEALRLLALYAALGLLLLAF